MRDLKAENAKLLIELRKVVEQVNRGEYLTTAIDRVLNAALAALFTETPAWAGEATCVDCGKSPGLCACAPVRTTPPPCARCEELERALRGILDDGFGHRWDRAKAARAALSSAPTRWTR